MAHDSHASHPAGLKSKRHPGHCYQLLGSATECQVRMLKTFRARQTLRARSVHAQHCVYMAKHGEAHGGLLEDGWLIGSVSLKRKR